MTKYTFLLPAYKAKYFEKSLLSIKKQLYGNFKCIVSDDCSPEDLKTIFDKIVGDDFRFTYRRNTENIGSKSLVSHWNALVQICDTDYFILSSDDDVYDSRFLCEIDDLSKKYPNVDLFRARCNRIDKNEDVFAEDTVVPEYENQIDFLYELYCHNRLKCIANYVFKTTVLKEKEGFVDFPLAWGSDDASIIKMSKNGVCNSYSVLFSFRCAQQNISSEWNSSVTKKKLIAKKLNLQWFDSYRCQLYRHNNILSITRKNAFIQYYIEECLNQIRMRSSTLSFKDALINYDFLKSRGGFLSKTSKLLYWWKWMLNMTEI